MRYHRLGHVEPNIKVRLGEKVKKGQLIAFNGTGNGQWPAHCHFDILTYKPKAWTEYVIGKSKQWVREHYADPRGLEKKVMRTFDHLGYGWLSDATYAGGHAYHSGLDLNGKGAGNADLCDKLYSPTDGVVVFVYNGVGHNGGWGPLLVIKEQEREESTTLNPVVEKPKEVPITPSSTTPGDTPRPSETPSETPNVSEHTNIPTDESHASSDNVVTGVGTTLPSLPTVKVEPWWKTHVDRLVAIIRQLFNL